mmetsp:Transcript_16060/g.40824  ORF Transcript_16060/g.40824 Transcript_16060/m.40824 type:complete len:201 (-) Transcript_16060:49-651(-)
MGKLIRPRCPALRAQTKPHDGHTTSEILVRFVESEPSWSSNLEDTVIPSCELRAKITARYCICGRETDSHRSGFAPFPQSHRWICRNNHGVNKRPQFVPDGLIASFIVVLQEPEILLRGVLRVNLQINSKSIGSSGLQFHRGGNHNFRHVVISETALNNRPLRILVHCLRCFERRHWNTAVDNHRPSDSERLVCSGFLIH